MRSSAEVGERARTTAPARLTAIADWVTLASAAASGLLLLVGEARHVVAGVPLTVGWPHAAFAAVALAAIRHAAVPAPPIHVRLHGLRVWMLARPHLASAVVVSALTRLTVLGVALLAVSAIGFPRGVNEPGTGRLALAALPSRYDANWYASIAADGYAWQGRFDRQQNLAFFPAYPMLMRGAGWITGAFDSRMPRERQLRRLGWCGLTISLLAFVWAAWLLSKLAAEMLDPSRARDPLLLLASYPFAVFFSAAYTESLFLLTALGAWYELRRGRPIRSGIWGLAAGLARPNGFFLSLPLFLIAIGLRDARGGAPRAGGPLARVAAAAMPGIGMLLFTGYLYQKTGVPFAWARMHGAWGREFMADSPLAFATATGNGLLQLAVASPFDTLNGLGVAFAVGMAWPVWRRLGPGWSLFVLANVVPPLLAGGLMSMGRLSSTLFPVFLALAAALPSRAVPPVVAVFALLQGLCTVLFYTWRGLY
jgi:hypothetical protein